MVKPNRQGALNKDQSSSQFKQQAGKNDIELGSEFTIGNTKSQSQKKSGRQINKKKQS